MESTLPSWFVGPGEDFRDVPGKWPYKVSDRGRVYSGHTDKILNPYTDEQGIYLIVDLRKDGDRNQRSVHTLVMEAFEGPPPSGEQVHHIDGDPKNNALSNLEYVEPEDNRGEAVEPGEDDSFVTADVAPF